MKTLMSLLGIFLGAVAFAMLCAFLFFFIDSYILY